uniref:Uncharacterized protein n=1 Tax=Romanomermis culicivorax TaxID=13658 RepID=A0A915JH68_ROMCU
MALISSGKNFLASPLCSTSILGLPPSLITLNGQCFMSDWTVASSKRRPINRLASTNDWRLQRRYGASTIHAN